MADSGHMTGSSLYINPTAPLICVPCSRDGQSLEAVGYCKTCREHLCTACYQHHCRPTPTRHHELVDGGDMPQVKIETEVPREFFVDQCPVHNQEMIKFYCNDHNLLACSMCVALDHRKCGHVDYIPEILNNPDFIDVLGKLQGLVHRVDVNLKMLKIKKTAIETYKSNARREMDALKTSLHGFVQLLDTKVDTAINAATESSLGAVGTLDEQWDLLKAELEEIRKGVPVEGHEKRVEGQVSVSMNVTLGASMQETSQTSQETPNVGGAKAAQGSVNLFGRIKESVNAIHISALRNLTGNVGLSPSPVLLNLSAMFSSFGPLMAKAKKGNNEPKFEIDLTVKLPKEEEKCQITGTTTLKNGQLLVVCDSQNKSVKLIDVQKDEIVSVVPFVSKPWGVARVTDNHIFVTLIDNQKLQSMIVLNGLLEDDEHNISVDGRCCGIACVNQKIVVSYVTPGKVEILNMKGEVLKKIDVDQNGDRLFEKPIHLALSPDGGRIYTSDWSKRRVLCLNPDGGVLARYEKVKSYGIAIDSTGMVYVGCLGPNSVHRLSVDCQLQKVVLEEKYIHETPDSLTYSRGTDTLYVALYDQEYIRQFSCS